MSYFSVKQEVVDFCKSYLVVNRVAFSDPRLELIINDARYKQFLPVTPNSIFIHICM